MGKGRDRQRSAQELAREVALFRYALIREPADAALTPRQRGALVRELAEAEHVGPLGYRVRVSRETIDRWIRTWRAGGFDALLPSQRRLQPRTPAEVLELAVALKREVPGRTAAQVAVVLAEHTEAAPSARTLQRHFARLGLNVRPDGSPAVAFGRFEAQAPNVRWTGDALHGPVVAGGKAVLFAFVDDHSRALVGYRWAHREDTVRLEAALRAGLLARGIPRSAYVDNGSPFVSSQLLRALGVLGVRLVHSTPRRPQGRGKIERFFRTVREQFLVELTAPGATDGMTVTRLNELFTAWVETVYHRRPHSETGQAPIERFLAAGPPPLPDPALLHEAFLWAEKRTVTKTATVSLHGNTYQVDPALVGCRVELVFDPFDLTELQVRYQDRPMGAAVPHRIGRHTHPAARPDAPEHEPPTPTGIDYLQLVHTRHTNQLGGSVSYADLPTDPAAPPPAQTTDPDPATGQVPGQLELTRTGEDHHDNREAS